MVATRALPAFVNNTAQADPTTQLSFATVHLDMTDDKQLVDATISEVTSSGRTTRVTSSKAPSWAESMDDGVRILEEILEETRAQAQKIASALSRA